MDLRRLTRRRPVGEGEIGELGQGPLVHLALEEDDVGEGMPPRDPSPVIEFRVIHRVQANGCLVDAQLQQEPHLLLADATRVGPPALIARRQAVTQPAVGTAHDLDVVGTQADFLVQFPVKRLFGGFADVDPALGKLPTPVTQAPRPKHVAVFARNNHPHIGTETIGIYGFGNTFHGAFYPRIHYPAVYAIRGSLPSRPAPARVRP